MCCPKNHSIIINRKCKHFTSSSLARNDRCEHFILSDLWRCAHEKQKNTCRKTIPSHHGMPSKWIDRSSMVCGTRHQTGNFLQLGKKAASERLCVHVIIHNDCLYVLTFEKVSCNIIPIKLYNSTNRFSRYHFSIR